MNLAETIKSIRMHLFLSQEDFASQLGVSFSTVNRWENDKAIPNISAMKKIKKYCNTHHINIDIAALVLEAQNDRS